MKLIIGLGNPGTEYRNTRHNAGFLFLDFLREKWDFPGFAPERKSASLVSVGIRNGDRVMLVKPETYMNRSGEAVSSIMNFYKLSPNDLLIVHDDLDLPFGSFKDATGSGAAGHNGVADVIEKLGTKDFRRIRIGIGRPQDGHDPSDYVLDRFNSDEETRLPEIFDEIFRSF